MSILKKVIGIAPSSSLRLPDTGCMDDHYKIGNNYTKRLAEAGCIPVGLSPVDNWLDEEALSLCDGFLVMGGPEFYPYHFQVIHHALETGKRYLGICLGSQLIYAYLTLRKTVEKRGCEGDLVKAICAYIEEMGEDFSVLQKIPNHRPAPTKRSGEEEAGHDVKLVEGTILHRLVGEDTLRAASFHNLHVPPEQTLAPVNAWSALGDGVVEGIEYGNNILGGAVSSRGGRKTARDFHIPHRRIRGESHAF